MYKGRRDDSIGPYRVIKELGKGTFGRVVQCVDKVDRVFAVKVVRSVPRYVEEAKIEARILDEIQSTFDACYQGTVSSRIVQMIDFFPFDSYFCLVFEELGMSLFEYQEQTNNRPFMISEIQFFMKDIFEALEFLHEECQIVHTDLKLENILFEKKFRIVSEGPSGIPSLPSQVD